MVLNLWFPCQRYQHRMMHLLPRVAEHITRALTTVEIFLSQHQRPKGYNGVASRATHTWRGEEDPALASPSFLVFLTMGGVSWSVGASLWTWPGSSHSLRLCLSGSLSGSVSCIYFSYKDSCRVEFRPQPKPANLLFTE